MYRTLGNMMVLIWSGPLFMGQVVPDTVVNTHMNLKSESRGNRTLPSCSLWTRPVAGGHGQTAANSASVTLAAGTTLGRGRHDGHYGRMPSTDACRMQTQPPAATKMKKCARREAGFPLMRTRLCRRKQTQGRVGLNNIIEVTGTLGVLPAPDEPRSAAG